MQEFIKVPRNKQSLSKKILVQGVGINDSWYMTMTTINGVKVRCPAYRAWCNMLKRCYSEKSLIINPTYTDCTVDRQWLYFSEFEKWHSANYKEGYHLDKDIKVKGNKIYSRDSCLYVKQSVNKLFLSSARHKKSDLPAGVYFDESRESYVAGIKVNGKRHFIGRFCTPLEANHCYKKAKNDQIAIAMLENKDIAKYLEKHLYDLSVNDI